MNRPGYKLNTCQCFAVCIISYLFVFCIHEVAGIELPVPFNASGRPNRTMKTVDILENGCAFVFQKNKNQQVDVFMLCNLSLTDETIK